MAVIILMVWLYFVIAFILVRMLFPEFAVKRRSKGEIKGVRVYNERGYDLRGFSPLGYHRNGTKYDDEGYDKNGLDKNGNPRPGPEVDNDIARQITLPIASRKRIAAAVLVPLAVIMIVIPTIYFTMVDSCLFGHTPLKTFCERPIFCTKCEQEVAPATGHTWIVDKKTGEEVCSFCRAERSNVE